MASQAILCNARLVTRDDVVAGTVVVRDGLIADIDGGTSTAPGAIDLDGDFLIPGLIELHTDNLEKHVAPRPGVWWPGLTAMVAHDAQVAASGITTVFDALTLGDRYRTEDQAAALDDLIGAVKEAGSRGLLRSEHRLHLRCEVSFAGVLDLYAPLVEDPAVGLISLMDHTPGSRQFADVEKYKELYQLGRHLSDSEVETHIGQLVADQKQYSTHHRQQIAASAHALGKVLASHDDACRDHIDEAKRDNVVIAEFPTSMEAAAAAREQGLQILMGSPNLLRGGSHSGNIAAADLARAGLLDILSSDYYPASLIIAAFRLADDDFGIPLPDAIATVTATPARAAGLDDRGEIAIGRRADMVRVHCAADLPLVRGVWRAGERVA